MLPAVGQQRAAPRRRRVQRGALPRVAQAVRYLALLGSLDAAVLASTSRAISTIVVRAVTRAKQGKPARRAHAGARRAMTRAPLPVQQRCAKTRSRPTSTTAVLAARCAQPARAALAAFANAQRESRRVAAPASTLRLTRPIVECAGQLALRHNSACTEPVWTQAR